MRLSLRVGSAAVLIILFLIVASRQYSSPGQSPQSFWHFDTTSFRSAFRPQFADAHRRKWGIGTGNTVALNYQVTPIEVPNEGIIVMGKLREEDTAWVSQELAE